MPASETAQKELLTSPLSSDAETEPLSFEESGSLKEEDTMNTTMTNNAVPDETTSVAPLTQLDTFSADSDLTDDTGSDEETRQPTAAFSDDGSSLSEAMEEDMPEADLERSALDGLAELASSTTGANEASTAVPPTSSTLTSYASHDEDEGDDERENDDSKDEMDTDAEKDSTREPGDETLHAAAAAVVSHKPASLLQRAVTAESGKRRAAATGGAPSLMMEPDMYESNPPSAATSRQGSPDTEADTLDVKEDVAPEETANEEEENVPTEAEAEAEGAGDEDKDPAEDEVPDAEDAETEAKAQESAADTPAGPAEADDAEAMQQRQDAMELLTRIEIGYAMLRERLHTERLEELEHETEMIQQGTHPELRLLHTLIDTRKERRLDLLDVWLGKSEKQLDLLGRVEDRIAWDNWRDQTATMRRTMMTDLDRKRRKLDREKRLIDAPPPARRHQPFDAEVVRKPPSFSRRTNRRPGEYAARHMSVRDARGFLAYPDVRGLEEYDVWMDMEQMGLRAMPPPPPGYGPPDEMAHPPPPPPDMYAPPYGNGPPLNYYGPPGMYVDGPPPPGPPPPRTSRRAPYEGLYMDPMDMPPPPPPPGGSHEYDATYEKSMYGAAAPPPPPPPMSGRAAYAPTAPTATTPASSASTTRPEPRMPPIVHA